MCPQNTPPLPTQMLSLLCDSALPTEAPLLPFPCRCSVLQREGSSMRRPVSHPVPNAVSIQKHKRPLQSGTWMLKGEALS